MVSSVTLSIGDRRYDMRCEDGAQDQLKALAMLVDARVRRLSSQGVSGESRLLMLAALGLAEELDVAMARLASVEASAAALQSDLINLEHRAADMLEGAIDRIDGLAARWA